MSSAHGCVGLWVEPEVHDFRSRAFSTKTILTLTEGCGFHALDLRAKPAAQVFHKHFGRSVFFLFIAMPEDWQ
jgi:hypothetical protein